MNELFDLCVDALIWLGDKVGMTYKEINIWIFCIIEPIIFFVMLYMIIHYKAKYKAIKNTIKELKDEN